MFSFFKNKKANINSVSFPDFGWTKTKGDTSMIRWINPEQTIALSINFFDLPPDIPTIKDIDSLRKFYRNAISKNEGGLVEVELFAKNKILFIRSLFKFPQEPTGITYIASLTIPFADCSFVIKVQAAEVGATGMRETLIANKLVSNGTISIDENGYSGWFEDPYDKDFKLGALMNRSEEQIFDVDFPDHHLTITRKLITQIEKEFICKPELTKLKLFGK